MTLAILEIELGILLIYVAIKCYALVPALAGRLSPGTHCTGSLLVLGLTVLSGLLSWLFGAGLAAAVAAAIAKAKGGGKSKGDTNPTPEPVPTPTPGGPAPGPGGSDRPPIEIPEPHPGLPLIGYQLTPGGNYSVTV